MDLRDRFAAGSRRKRAVKKEWSGWGVNGKGRVEDGDVWREERGRILFAHF